MDYNDHNTAGLWQIFYGLIGVLSMVAVLTFGYFSLEDTIHDLMNGPQYSSEQLAQMTKERERSRVVERAENYNLIENGIHVRTGLKADPNLQLIIGACTSCHSGKLIAQNRATREGWKAMIEWMQETQGLVDLGNKEPIVLDYLAKYYAPEKIGRRVNLDVQEIEWYVLGEE